MSSAAFLCGVCALWTRGAPVESNATRRQRSGGGDSVPGAAHFPGDVAPQYTQAAESLRTQYRHLLQVVPGNARPGSDFDQTIGSFNFQDPEGVLSTIAKSEGRELRTEELTVVDVGGGGHTPPAMRPFVGVSRVIAFDASTSSLNSNKELRSRGHRRFPEIINTIVTPANMRGHLQQKALPKQFALLKIDIDSVDCAILNATLSEYEPTVVLIEINPAFPPPIRFGMKWVPNVQHGAGSPSVLYGCSLSYAADIAAAYGYALLQAPIEDALFVRAAHLPLFGNVVHGQREIYRFGNPFLYSFRRFGAGFSEEWMAWPNHQQRKELFSRVLGNVTREAIATGRGRSMNELEKLFHIGLGGAVDDK